MKSVNKIFILMNFFSWNAPKADKYQLSWNITAKMKGIKFELFTTIKKFS